MAKVKKKLLNFNTSKCKGEKLQFYARITNVEDGKINIFYKATLCNVGVYGENGVQSELDNSIFLLWVKNIKIDDELISKDLQFVTEFASEKENTFTLRKSGNLVIDYPSEIVSNEKMSHLTFELVVDKMESSVDCCNIDIDFVPYKLDEKNLLNIFNVFDHKSKSQNNLENLSEFLSLAYKINPSLANKVWTELWDENCLLEGLQRRYFILAIFKLLVYRLGTIDSVELLLMDDNRLNLILERDYYGIEMVVKNLCIYYIVTTKYQNLMDMLDLYLNVNSITDTEAADYEELCSFAYSAINPKDTNFGQPLQDVVLENIPEIDISKLRGFYDYLNLYYKHTTLNYILASYISSVDKSFSLETDFIKKCVNALPIYSFKNTIDFLIKYEVFFNEDEINSILRKLISTHDLFFRNGFDILEERKSWFISKISNEKVFLGFFEKKRCLFSDFEIDYLIQLMLRNCWDKLFECFELVVENGDSCRLGSLLTFISNTVQSYKKKYRCSKKKIEIGPIKITLDMKYSTFSGEEYTEISTIDKKNMEKYKDLLYGFLSKLPSESREAKSLTESIQDLEERLE